MMILFVSLFMFSFAKIHPIVFAPGLGGQQLEAKLSHSYEPHSWCRHNEDWYTLWMNILDEVPWLSLPCFMNNIKNHFDKDTKTHKNTKGVSVRFKDFGGVDGVEYMAPIAHSLSKYMYDFIKYFEDRGYKRGVSFRTGGYDWRKGPQAYLNGEENSGEYEKFKRLIENTYEINGNTTVSIVAHSMGCTYIQTFLAHYIGDDQEWKDKYIHSYFSLGGPYKGAEISIFQIIRADTFQQPMIKPTNEWRDVLASIGGVSWMMPSDITNKTIITTDKRTYSMQDLKSILTDLHQETTYDIYEWVKQIDTTLVPKVRTYCLHGDTVRTPIGMHVPDLENPLEGAQIIEYTDGDGTVPLNSLEVCSNWQYEQKHPVTTFALGDIDHRGSVYSAKVHEYIFSIVTED